MKQIYPRMLFLILLITFAQWLPAQQSQQLEPFNAYFKVEKKWLQLPVKNGAPKRIVEIWVEGKDERFFDIELADNEKPDWYAFLDISDWNGKKIELRVNQMKKGSSTFRPIVQSDADDGNPDTYAEELRAQFHFSPKRGWTNDPNGLVYYNGEYHLFFQHNPYGRGWGNMTWGHAVSKNLIHWEEVGDALHQDHFGPIFSGGGVVDEKNTSGLGKDGKPAMVVFYTAARAWAQGLAWSTDGRKFTKSELPVVPRINKDNRDPKVIWHEPTQKWVMVFWVETDSGEHTIQFLTSPDLKSWTATSSVKGGKGNDRYLFECPELYELPVDGNENDKKWVLMAADNQYAVGSFDGENFTVEEGRLRGQFGRGYYASQTFSNEPKGRRIEIGWWQTATDKGSMSFNQSMSIPMEVKLKRTPEGIRIARFPIEETKQLRTRHYGFKKLKVGADGLSQLRNINEELVEMRVDVSPGKANEIVFNVRGLEIRYDVKKQELSMDAVTAPVPLKDGKLNFILLVDRVGVELFSGDGLVFMPLNKNMDSANKSFDIKAAGPGKAVINTLDIYQLKSIWQQ